MIRPVIVALALLVGGCAAEKVPIVLTPAADARVWPQLPDSPRYAYAGTLTGERDFADRKEEGKSTGTILLEIVTGFLFGDPKYGELLRPVSGLVDAKERVIVVDTAQPGLAVFDLPNKDFDVWRRASDEEDFISPVGVAEDGEGGFLVTDSELGQVFRLAGDGTPRGSFGGAGLLSRPTGLARDARTGNVYVSDTQTHRVVIFSAAGEVLDIIGSRGRAPGHFNYPTHLAIAGDQLYVADTLNFRIQVFNLDGDGKLTIGQLGINVGNLTRPKGVAVGGNGRVYVVESYFDHLLVYDAEGRFLLPIGGSGSGIGQFYLPAGVWTDQTGRVYIADMFNGRIQVFQELTPGGGE